MSYQENRTSGYGWTCPSCQSVVQWGQMHSCGQPHAQVNQTIFPDWGLTRIAVALESIADSLDVLAHPLLKVHGDTQVCRCSEDGCPCGEPKGPSGDRGKSASPEGEDSSMGLTD